MRIFALSFVLALLASLPVAADDDGPQLPRVPRGFDEGRDKLVKESGDNLISAEMLVNRTFEQADVHELARFIHFHLSTAEKNALSAELELSGKLARRTDVASTLELLGGIEPKELAGALGKTLKDKGFDLPDALAWLYARGLNFRILQRAMDGQRLDPFKLRRELRAKKDAKARDLVIPGLWEFNVDDGREEKGGYYDGVQLVECMTALGWGVDDFAKVLTDAKVGPIKPNQRALIEWGDPNLLWPTLELRIPESELVKHIRAHYKGNHDPRVLEVGLLRAETFTRWFRTGGPGVKGVYTGPWPDAKGVPKPPSSKVNDIAGDDADQLVAALDEEIIKHFDSPAETLTVVIYDDGSARAIIDKPGRTPVNFGVGSPFGNVATTRQLYEGRISLRGRNGLFYAVYDENESIAPQEFELANVKLRAGDTLLMGDLDNGMELTPILLKRTTRLVELD